MNNLSSRPQNKNFGERTGRATSLRRHLEYKQRYEQNPNVCKQCNVKIPYSKQANRFCNSSCAAKWNNAHVARRHGPLPKPLEVRKSIPRHLFRPVSFKQCVTCSRWFRVKGPSHIYCSPDCNVATKILHRYRLFCKFKLSPVKHPELFNLKLIAQYGWYNPVNRPGNTNLTGVCWDHLFRIEEGFKLKVPPSVMSHPANAELVPWPVNHARKQSMVTLDQLYERINLWDSGQRWLPTFYPLS